MSNPAYISIAGVYARKIRNGDLPAGSQLPSYAEIAERHNVSDIVVRKALQLLQSQGLVRSVRRRGIFVTDQPNLVRVSPERQLESPEVTFSNEGDRDIRVERESKQVHVADRIVEIFGLTPNDKITHVVTRISEGGRPVSISDTYMAPGVEDISAATALEETLCDRIPPETHATWLRTTAGDLVKAVHQRFLDDGGRVLMISDVSYPRDRYDAFVFRMTLTPKVETTKPE